MPALVKKYFVKSGAGYRVRKELRERVLFSVHGASFILSDLGMPGMTGVELIEAVRKRNQLAGVKAIALSGFGRDSDVQAALRAGFDAHLTKPVTLDALLNTMARLRAR